MPLPHWGGLLRTSRSLPIGRAGLGESMLGSASARPPGLQAGGHFLPRATSGRAPRACWAWHLSAGLGALFTTSHRCGDEPGGEEGAGADCWKSEALGSACLMNERGANRDTEILIRGSLWGGCYHSVLIGCVAASQHPGRVGSPTTVSRGPRGEQRLMCPFLCVGRLRPCRAQLVPGGGGRF